MQLNIVTNIEVFSIDMTSRLPKHYPDIPKHHPDTSRHTPDLSQTLAFCSINSKKTTLDFDNSSFFKTME